jgi:hypothetical protein
MSNSDYFDLKQLQGTRGYQKLQALWAHEGAKILDSVQKAAAKNNETNWRYVAGQMKGFDLAITHLERAILQMEKEGETGESPATEAVEELMKDIRGEQNK